MVPMDLTARGELPAPSAIERCPPHTRSTSGSGGSGPAAHSAASARALANAGITSREQFDRAQRFRKRHVAEREPDAVVAPLASSSAATKSRTVGAIRRRRCRSRPARRMSADRAAQCAARRRGARTTSGSCAPARIGAPRDRERRLVGVGHHHVAGHAQKRTAGGALPSLARTARYRSVMTRTVGRNAMVTMFTSFAAGQSAFSGSWSRTTAADAAAAPAAGSSARCGIW